jgi:hypothetical protein
MPRGRPRKYVNTDQADAARRARQWASSQRNDNRVPSSQVQYKVSDVTTQDQFLTCIKGKVGSSISRGNGVGSRHPFIFSWSSGGPGPISSTSWNPSLHWSGIFPACFWSRRGRPSTWCAKCRCYFASQRAHGDIRATYTWFIVTVISHHQNHHQPAQSDPLPSSVFSQV